jgi:hypothetical protein
VLLEAIRSHSPFPLERRGLLLEDPLLFVQLPAIQCQTLLLLVDQLLLALP